MSSAFRDPCYDPSRRRRGARRDHRHTASSSSRSPLTRLATAAIVAYGAYRLGTWAWNAYTGGAIVDSDSDDKDEEDSDEEDSDLRRFSRGTAGDYSYRAVERDMRREEGFSPSHSWDEAETDDGSLLAVGNCNETNVERRSRRSRIDWSQSHERSISPSTTKDYHHHSPQCGVVNNGCSEKTETICPTPKGMAAATASGIGSAVCAGISAGIHAYNNQVGNAHTNSDAQDRERRLRMGRCRLETLRPMSDFLMSLKKAIAKETDSMTARNELKRLRARKRDILDMETKDRNREAASDEEDGILKEERRLWNDIKNKSVSRLVTTVYAHTIVFLVLTVQVNLLGGRLLREEQEEMKIPTNAEHHTVVAPVTDRYRASLMKTYHFLFSKGIPSLAKSVGNFVHEILRQWDVLDGDEVSLEDISMWIERVRNQMERQSCSEGSSLARYIIPPEGESNAEDADAGTADELAGLILDETYDLLESPTFANAERQCLDATFEQLQSESIVKLFLTEDRVPLASVVTYLQKSAVATFHSSLSREREEIKGWGGVFGMMTEPLASAAPNEYISRLDGLDAVIEMRDVCF